MSFLERLGRWRIHLHRIDRAAVLPHTEIEMRTGRAACRAYISDHFALTDTLAGSDAFSIFRKMQICCGIDRVMPDSHSLSTGSLMLDTCDYSVTDGHHRGTDWSCIIHSGVRPHLLCHGMAACIGKSGTDAGEFQRSLKEGLPHALSLLVPVYVSSVLLVIHDRRQIGAVMSEDSISDRVHGKHFPVTHLLVVQHPETVSLLKSEEIHSPCVNI